MINISDIQSVSAFIFNFNWGDLMKLSDSKKTMNATQSNEKEHADIANRSNYESKKLKKTLLLEKSDYGWDGDY